MTIAEKYAAQWMPNGEVTLVDLIQAAVDEAQSVPVVGEPTDAAYKWMISNGVEPLTSLHKLGERLAALLDEDQFSECETLLLTAITAINTFVPVPAAELATLRKDAERYRWLRMKGAHSDAVDKVHMLGPQLDAAIDAAIAGEET